MIRSLRSSTDGRASRLLRVLVAALWLGAALLAPARPVQAAATPADAKERARSVLQDPEFQGSLPEQAKSQDEEDAPVEPSSEAASRRDRPEPEEDEEPAAGTASLASMTVYLLVGIAVILLVVWILMEGADRRAKVEPAKADGGGGDEPALEGRDFALDDATRLASQGLYAEAMHVLLLIAIHQVAERSRATLPASRTSRELVRLLPLGADSREAFGEMVRAVELTLFGGAPAGAQDYQRSLECFRHVTGRPA
ncbi:MAG TPA: DUF4129 domain-containing protein [Thermoanaerobaculia bacterium]|nr:DUF4129 domain-containing protein [Thermoanaerobaculia bacterium]